MRNLIPLMLTMALLAAPLPALADHDGRPHEDKCYDREQTCTEVPAGEMACMPETGLANDKAVVVGSADSGTFKLEAVGAVAKDTPHECVFEIRVDPSQIRFNEGYTFGLLAPYGAAWGGGWSPCWAYPGESCTATASFSWQRAAHGVTFDVPFTLHVNGVEVARGEVHYYDPPLFEEVLGGPMVLP